MHRPQYSLPSNNLCFIIAIFLKMEFLSTSTVPTVEGHGFLASLDCVWMVAFPAGDHLSSRQRHLPYTHFVSLAATVLFCLHLFLYFKHHLEQTLLETDLTICACVCLSHQGGPSNTKDTLQMLLCGDARGQNLYREISYPNSQLPFFLATL